VKGDYAGNERWRRKGGGERTTLADRGRREFYLYRLLFGEQIPRRRPACPCNRYPPRLQLPHDDCGQKDGNRKEEDNDERKTCTCVARVTSNQLDCQRSQLQISIQKLRLSAMAVAIAAGHTVE
jgi:hypothetical protein